MMKNLLIVFVVAIFCFCNTHPKTWKGTLQMPPEIEMDSIIDSTIPLPVMFPSPESYALQLIDIFAVPRDGAIGTNWLNNAITIMRLEKDGINFEEVNVASHFNLNHNPINVFIG
jgi:hypothetical protein